MTYKIQGYEPAAVFHFFEDISAIPRGSGNEAAISDFLVQFAKERGLFVYRDDANNVLIRKPASPGKEALPGVILQGHTDMVCEKIAGNPHDFTKDGISLFVEDGLLKAKGTTLGADDGAAVALMLYLLDDNTLSHPPLECLFTTGEEVGLLGAVAFDCTLLEGSTFINLDSEDEGVATVSSAGGMRVTLCRDIRRHDGIGYEVELEITGLTGGHSGVEIGLGRFNAITLVAGALKQLLENPYAELVHFTGGTADNAIPRECKAALLYRTASAAEDALFRLSEIKEQYKAEIAPYEKGLRFNFACHEDREVSAIRHEDSLALVNAVRLLPNGVLYRNPAHPEMILTSTNLGIVSTDRVQARLVTTPRSSVDLFQTDTLSRISQIADMAGFTLDVSAAYPGWAYKEVSPVRDLFVSTYEALFQKPMVVEAIHAGLETGIFVSAKPELDTISVGPTLKNVHTPDEYMDLASMERFCQLLLAVLEKMGESPAE